jgi:16S rRNA (adenine1518-N6/adenine1519-N6)-dimethyltransferase
MGLFKIPASCFFPEPDVDSAGVTLARRAEPLLSAGQTSVFTKLVRRAFGQRRKMMLKLLRQDWPASAMVGAFEQLHLSPQCRAEDVPLETFVGLTRLLTQPTTPDPTT